MTIAKNLFPSRPAQTAAAFRPRSRLAPPAPLSRLSAVGTAFVLLLSPTLAHATTTDLQTATESGSAVIMYVCGVLVAIGIVTAGVAMMMGRQSIAKWALGGALIAGLAFPIVKTIWGNVGITAPDVSTFTSGS